MCCSRKPTLIWKENNSLLHRQTTKRKLVPKIMRSQSLSFSFLGLLHQNQEKEVHCFAYIYIFISSWLVGLKVGANLQCPLSVARSKSKSKLGMPSFYFFCPASMLLLLKLDMTLNIRNVKSILNTHFKMEGLWPCEFSALRSCIFFPLDFLKKNCTW